MIRWAGAGRDLAACALVSLALVAASCAPKGATPSAAVTPARYADYPYPAVPATLQAPAALVRAHDAAWRFLQGDNLRDAERGFATLVRKQPAFYPALAGMGFVALARTDARAALLSFERALAANAGYVPALVGKGDALTAQDRAAEALDALRAALALDDSLTDVRRRVEVLQFRAVEARLGEARAAEAAGDWAAARAAYERALAASPDSSLVQRQLARVERRLGDRPAALAHATASAAMDPHDVDVWLLLADLQQEAGDAAAAIDALRRARDVDPSIDVASRIEQLQQRAAVSTLPEEYRLLAGAPRLTRGELAALVGIRFDTLVASARRPATPLVTDVRGHWASTWILAVARAGIMEAFSNHAFQPRTLVNRGDLAVVVSRMLAILAARDKGLASRWMGIRKTFTDLGTGHAQYPAASTAVAAGVMPTLDNGTFQVGRPVSGAEALEVMARLDPLVKRAGLARAGAAAR